MSRSPSLVWGLINSLQLITYQSFINVHFPADVEIYLIALLNLANLEVFPTDGLKDYFGDKFDDLIGYDEEEDWEYDSSRFLTQSMIDAEVYDPRIIRSNILIFVFICIALALALLAFGFRVCFSKKRKIRSFC